MKTFTLTFVSLLAIGALAAPAASAAPPVAPSEVKPFTAVIGTGPVVELNVLPKGELELKVPNPRRPAPAAVWVLCEKSGNCFLRAPGLLKDKSWHPLPKGSVRVSALNLGASAEGEGSAQVTVKVGAGKAHTVADVQDPKSYVLNLNKDNKPHLSRVGLYGPKSSKPLPKGTQVIVEMNFTPVGPLPPGF